MFNLKKEKKTQIEIRFVVTRGRGLGDLGKGSQKVQTSSYRINKYSDEMYNTMTILNTAVWCI